MKIESTIILNEAVDNTERKFGAALEYFPVYIRNAEGENVPAMFTADELDKAIERAEKNPEDMPKKDGWWIF